MFDPHTERKVRDDSEQGSAGDDPSGKILSDGFEYLWQRIEKQAMQTEWRPVKDELSEALKELYQREENQLAIDAIKDKKAREKILMDYRARKQSMATTTTQSRNVISVGNYL